MILLALLFFLPSRPGMIYSYAPVPHSLDKQEIDILLQRLAATAIPSCSDQERFTIVTNLGDLQLRLFCSTSPIQARNFKRLVFAQFYRYTHFHQIVPGEYLVGGDILSRDRNPNNDGQGNPGYNLERQDNDHSARFGSIAMVPLSEQNDNGSQFMILLHSKPDKALVFGQVIRGFALLDRLATIPLTYDQQNAKSRPLHPLIINDIIYQHQ